MKRVREIQADIIPDAPPRLDRRRSSGLEECACGGMGMIILQDAQGHRSARDCSCRIQKRIDARLDRAEIPQRYRQPVATLDTYDAMGKHPSLARALARARRFAEEYPVGTAGRGMLLVGPVGVGKTHLAVGILRIALLEKGARGAFVDFHQLCNRIKKTFTDKTISEADILEPILAADVLLLDDLGAVRETDWTRELVDTVINERYNAARSTLITTNFDNAGSAAAEGGSDYAAAVSRAARSETLEERIGARMHSRLQQMCDVVEMTGDDFRKGKGRT